MDDAVKKIDKRALSGATAIQTIENFRRMGDFLYKFIREPTRGVKSGL